MGKAKFQGFPGAQGMFSPGNGRSRTWHRDPLPDFWGLFPRGDEPLKKEQQNLLGAFFQLKQTPGTPGCLRFPGDPGIPVLQSHLEFIWSLDFSPQICKGTPQHEEICLGLFTLVLTDPAQAQKVRKTWEREGIREFPQLEFPA